MVKVNWLKSGLPPMAAINGVMMSFTSSWTTALNAVPTTTAIARSITFPRMMKSLKPLSIRVLRLTQRTHPTARSLRGCQHRCEHVGRRVTHDLAGDRPRNGDHQL